MAHLTGTSESNVGNAASESNTDGDENIIHRYYQAIERGDVSNMLSCVDDKVEVTFLEGSRNWSGKTKAQTQFKAWLKSSNVVVKHLKITKSEGVDQSANIRCFLASCDFGSGVREMRYEVTTQSCGSLPKGGDLITRIDHLC
jgi:hypothetical protein